VARRAVRAMIGQELQARFEVAQDLPHEMLTLLIQLNEREQKDRSQFRGTDAVTSKFDRLRN
jgi:hypothetical protein